MKRLARVVYLTERAMEITRRLLLAHPDGALFRNQNGKPWTDVFTDALRNYQPSHNRQRVISGSRSFYDAMMEDGAIGVVNEELPLDLATNRRHMEGFGRGR